MAADPLHKSYGTGLMHKHLLAYCGGYPKSNWLAVIIGYLHSFVLSLYAVLYGPIIIFVVMIVFGIIALAIDERGRIVLMAVGLGFFSYGVTTAALLTWKSWLI